MIHTCNSLVDIRCEEQKALKSINRTGSLGTPESVLHRTAMRMASAEKITRYTKTGTRQDTQAKYLAQRMKLVGIRHSTNGKTGSRQDTQAKYLARYIRPSSTKRLIFAVKSWNCTVRSTSLHTTSTVKLFTVRNEAGKIISSLSLFYSIFWLFLIFF